MSLNDPHWAQISLNESKWAHMTLNKPNNLEWGDMNLIQLKRLPVMHASVACQWCMPKSLPVMHASVRHDICYDFQNRLKNAENNYKKALLWSILIRFFGHALWCLSIHAPNWLPKKRPRKVTQTRQVSLIYHL